MDPGSLQVNAFGRGVLACLALLVFGSLIAVISRADWPIALGPGDWAAVRFTLLQSVISALLSVVLAIPVARALSRRQFFGRGFLMVALGAPFILPVIVAVFGLLAIWGRSGLFSDVLGLVGLGRVDIYGFPGVVLAHVFFNLPLATRLILQGWVSIPAEHFRLSAQLGFSAWDEFRCLEIPMLRQVIPGALVLVFILCMTSFATVLALGGGPKATSVELAIYAALRFDFDLGRAAVLALVQVILSGGAAILLLSAGRPVDLGQGLGGARRVWRQGGRGIDSFVICTAALFLLMPMGAIVLRGVGGLFGILDVRLMEALWMSLQITALSTLLAVGGAIGIASLAARSSRGWLIEVTSTMVLVVSPFVLGTGLFIIINPWLDPFAMALPVTAVVNAALSLPFCVRVLVPALQQVERNYGRLGTSLGLSGWDRTRLMLWPALRRPLGFATGLSAALSMGDLGVIALFAPVDGATLPLLMYRLMGAYQMDAAAGVALVLVAVSFGLFAAFDRGGQLGRHL